MWTAKFLALRDRPSTFLGLVLIQAIAPCTWLKLESQFSRSP